MAGRGSSGGEQLVLATGVVPPFPPGRLAVVATAADVRAGHFLEMAGGVVLVEAVRTSHGGREACVRPARGGPGRSLWFWPGQVVRIVPRTVKRPATSPGSARTASGRLLLSGEGSDA